MDDFMVLSYTQHWVILDGWYYREAWVRTGQGAVKFVAIAEGPVGA